MLNFAPLVIFSLADIDTFATRSPQFANLNMGQKTDRKRKTAFLMIHFYCFLSRDIKTTIKTAP